VAQQLPIVGGSLGNPAKGMNTLGAIIGIWIIWEVFKKMKKAVGM
jgi:hypothetical protein